MTGSNAIPLKAMHREPHHQRDSVSVAGAGAGAAGGSPRHLAKAAQGSFAQQQHSSGSPFTLSAVSETPEGTAAAAAADAGGGGGGKVLVVGEGGRGQRGWTGKQHIDIVLGEVSTYGGDRRNSQAFFFFSVFFFFFL